MFVWLQGNHAGRVRSLVLLITLAVFVSACGGGGGGVDFAGGQGPDPVVVDVPIAYVKRPLPLDDQDMVEMSDVRELITFNIGADLFLRDRASPTSAEVNITESITQGLGDIRDLEVSWDGTKVLFAMRAQFIEGAAEEDQPRWNIWEYDIANDVLRRIIASDITAEAGHDVAPHYLPDGRIVFSSTRQRQSSAILLDEGKPQFAAVDENDNEFAFVLHVMNDDGSDIHQISFNQSHDLDPTVLSNGQIVFSRWDNSFNNDDVELFRMNPDGTELELLYGANSHDTGTNNATVQFIQPREMPDGQIMALIRQFVVDDFGADITTIDIANYVENVQPTADNAGVMTGPAQVASTANDVRTDGTISPGGKFSSAFPLWDGTSRMFVSWSECRLLETPDPLDPMTTIIVPCTPDRLADPTAVPAPPIYSIWVYDTANGTQLPVLVPEEGMMFTDVVAAQVRTLPPVIFDKAATGEFDPQLVAENAGMLNIRSVYDLDGIDTAPGGIEALADPAQNLATDRPARFLRIEKAVSQPDDDVRDIDNTAFGPSVNLGMREIIGYVPVEPDGSVVAKVPANVALAIGVLDVNGRRTTPRHLSWLQVLPGEEVKCDGCHVNGTGNSHGRREAFTSVYAGAVADGQPFPNTDAAIFADFGETMAEAKARISCATDCADITPTVDVVFDDIWTDEVAAGRLKDPSFTYSYSGLTTPAPISAGCQTNWTPACRTVINYELHLQPIWDAPRLAPDGVTDATCSVCHDRIDAMGNLQVPPAQLELTGGPHEQVAEQVQSYRELLFNDFELELNMGALQDRQVVVGQDPVTGADILAPVAVPRSMTQAGANASFRFFAPFAVGNSHEAYLNDAELRLISEWLDIGAQYYNNPFDAPEN